MLRRPPRSTRTDTLVPTRRASGRAAGPGDRRQAQLLQTAGGGLGDGHARRYRCGTFWEALQLTSERGHILRARYHHYPVTRLRSKPPPGSHASAYPEPVRQQQGRAENHEARKQAVADEQLTQREGGGTSEGRAE